MSVSCLTTWLTVEGQTLLYRDVLEIVIRYRDLTISILNGLTINILNNALQNLNAFLTGPEFISTFWCKRFGTVSRSQ